MSNFSIIRDESGTIRLLPDLVPPISSRPFHASVMLRYLSVKLIRIYHNARNGEEWDLTDQRGHKLGPNVYLYRVSAKMLSTGLSGKEKTVTSSIKKLVIHPPR